MSGLTVVIKHYENLIAIRSKQLGILHEMIEIKDELIALLQLEVEQKDNEIKTLEGELAIYKSAQRRDVPS